VTDVYKCAKRVRLGHAVYVSVCVRVCECMQVYANASRILYHPGRYL